MSASSCSRSKESRPNALSRTVSGSAGVSLSCLPSGLRPFFFPCLMSVSPLGWRSLVVDLLRRNEAKSDGIAFKGRFSRGLAGLPRRLVRRPSVKDWYRVVSAVNKRREVGNRPAVLLGEDCGGPLGGKLRALFLGPAS